ncbi:MAG: TetR/AcrR family transcriptional regulator [Acidimicrobiia bacterium]|nr:TetR/AcrR family transcriptional regulator [Acidimicrobiia bacterium]MYB74461.1 TetR/AcrR family transcriptional regulator [Acidimicrobiia bacterium]MYI00022.1 TetR/AcrR family transcriptional regulator [Acidimicrobiia bacterium]
MPRSPEPAREALIAVAERLFAERGVDAVTVRDVVTAAEQRNSSAVQYHFGNKAGLLQAILDPHQDRLDARRAEMFDQLGERPTLDELIEVLVRPLASLLDSESGRHYIRIRAQLVSAARLPSDSELMRDVLAGTGGGQTANEPRPGIRRVAQALVDLVDDTELPDFGHRLELTAVLLLHGLADFAQRHPGATAAEREAFTEVLIRSVAAISLGDRVISRGR